MEDDLQLSRRIELSKLYDLYSPVLTEKQRLIFEMHDQEDLSFSEISKELSISRQAVSDQLQTVRERLRDLEKSLGFYRRTLSLEKALRDLKSLLASEKSRLPEGFSKRLWEIITGLDRKS